MKPRKNVNHADWCITQARDLLTQSLSAIDTETIATAFKMFFSRQLARYRKDRGWQHRTYLQSMRYKARHDMGDLNFRDVTAYLLYSAIWEAFFVEGVNYPHGSLPIDANIYGEPLNAPPSKVDGELRISTAEVRMNRGVAA